MPSPSLAAPTPTTTPRALPRYTHIVVVLFENHERSQVLGSSAPYLSGLAAHGADFTNSFAIEHPSEPNYLDLFSGSDQGVFDDSCPHRFTSNNLAHELIATGRTFIAYAEGLPSAGSTVCSSGDYARKHAPWTDFTDLPQQVVAQPYRAFPTDLTRLPTVAWIIPDLCHDMHDCPVSTGDAWASHHLDAYARWARSHNSLLIVTFDEDDSGANNHIATFFYGAHVRVGTYAERIDHFTVLRTLEKIYDLPALGAAAHRRAITDAFTP